jgi:thiol:disulfide interchange protein DsbC
MRLIAFLALSFLSFTALGDTADDVRARLLERYPSTPVDTVRATPITGLFEVAMGRKIVYVDATGQYFLFGRIFDLPGNRDLTEDRLRDLSRLDVSLIQPDQTLEQGEGSQVVYVFSDPACGHCQKLEQTLAAMPTLRVRTILLPLQPGSTDLARDIWCAPDRQRAWSAWMLKGTRPDRAPEACQARCPGAEPGLGQALRHPGHAGAGLAGWARLPGRHGSARAIRLADPRSSRRHHRCHRGQPMNYRHLIPCLLLPTLVGCAGSLSGLDGSKKLSCPVGEGVTCKPMSQVYEESAQPAMVDDADDQTAVTSAAAARRRPRAARRGERPGAPAYPTQRDAHLDRALGGRRRRPARGRLDRHASR